MCITYYYKLMQTMFCYCYVRKTIESCVYRIVDNFRGRGGQYFRGFQR